MERTEIARVFADMEQFGGQTVTVCGWARTIRDMKNFGFIELNDGSCFRNLQVVFDADSLENYKDIAKLQKFTSERGKILPRRATGACAMHQRQLTEAIKRARQVALLPYVVD